MTASSRLVIVGEAPAGVGREALPALEGLVGRRLAKRMGLTDDQFREMVVRKNIFETPDEGKHWNAQTAYLRAMKLMSVMPRNANVVVLGKKAATAFKIVNLPQYAWHSAVRILSGDALRLAHIPHPSGLNRRYNDPAELERASRFLREALRDSR